MQKHTFLIYLFLLLGFFACDKKSEAQEENKKPYVIVLSLDGFRWDYTTMVETPNFDRLAAQGVKAESLQPSFPSKTFPNHYTIATGLYPGNHGLVNNSFYDYEKDVVYKISNRSAVEDKDFYGGEPIWNTVEKQGVKAACFFWVGSEAPVQDMRPSIWKRYEHNFPWEARADSIITWLQMPEANRPHLLMWYLHEPDGIGHKFGPKSSETKEQILELDAFLGRFLDKLEALPIADQVNLIVTTDHGMGATSSERYVGVSEYVQSSDLEYYLSGNPVFFIQPKRDKVDEVYEKLNKIEHVTVSKKGERPEHWHYNEHKRIADIIVVADSAWSVGWGTSENSWAGGTHGYDPRNKDMHGIFYAKGPSFKQNYVHSSFENVDIYSLISHILEVTPSKNDGKFERVKGLLKVE